MGVKRRWIAATLAVLAMLAGWVAADFASSSTHSLRAFDGREVGALETAMWQSYYDHERVRLFVQLGHLLRRQYHLTFWRSSAGAFYAAKAAVVFQRGHGRSEYELTLPDLERFYGLIRRGSSEPFDVPQVARAELEWWIIHRERARHTSGELEKSLAELQSLLYHRPDSDFATHARLRAEAMVLRDARASSGGMREEDWTRIRALLEGSWSDLEMAVNQGHPSTGAANSR